MSLKDTAKAAGLKQCEIAAALKVGEPAVSLWFSRQAAIPHRYILPLAGLLNVSIEDVLAEAVPLPKAKDNAA